MQGGHRECACAVQGSLCRLQVPFCVTEATGDPDLPTRPEKAEVVKHSAAERSFSCQEHFIEGPAGTRKTPGRGCFWLHGSHLTRELEGSASTSPQEFGASLACGLSGQCTLNLAALQDAALGFGAHCPRNVASVPPMIASLEKT